MGSKGKIKITLHDLGQGADAIDTNCWVGYVSDELKGAEWLVGYSIEVNAGTEVKAVLVGGSNEDEIVTDDFLKDIEDWVKTEAFDNFCGKEWESRRMKAMPTSP